VLNRETPPPRYNGQNIKGHGQNQDEKKGRKGVKDVLTGLWTLPHMSWDERSGLGGDCTRDEGAAFQQPASCVGDLKFRRTPNTLRTQKKRKIFKKNVTRTRKKGQMQTGPGMFRGLVA